MYPNATEEMAAAALAAVFMNPNTAPACLRPVSRQTALMLGCCNRMPAYDSDRNPSAQVPLVVSVVAAMKMAAVPSQTRQQPAARASSQAGVPTSR